MLQILGQCSGAVGKHGISGIHIATNDELSGPDGDEPYVLVVNQTEYGNTSFRRANILSARPDLKKYTALRFRHGACQDVKRNPDVIALGEDVVLVFMEAPQSGAAVDTGLL